MRLGSGPTRVLVELAIALVALVLAGWLAGLVATKWLDAADRSILATVTAARSASLTPVAELVTNLGSALVVVPLALLTCLWLWTTRRRADAVLVALSVLGSLILPELVKVLVARARPSILHLEPVASYSFPSSHAAHAVGFYCAVALVGSAGRDLRLRALLWSIALFLVAVVGWTRLYLGVHYPSDVLGGYLLGAGWLVAVNFTRRDFRSLLA